jgi:hypothetical protein
MGKHYGVRQDLTMVSSANFRLAQDPISIAGSEPAFRAS